MTNFIISLCLISIVFGISSGFSKESTLKKSLLEYYDPTTKPEGQTTVEISVRPVNMKMCPKSQVHIQFLKPNEVSITNPGIFSTILSEVFSIFEIYFFAYNHLGAHFAYLEHVQVERPKINMEPRIF